MVRVFSFVRNDQTLFQGSGTILHSYQQWMRGMSAPVAPQPRQHLVLSMFWILAILINVPWCLSVLGCNSLMTWCWASFHMLTCHLCIFLGKASVKLFDSYLIALYFLLNFKILLCIWDTCPLTDRCFTNIFSPSMSCFFHSLNSIYWRADVFNFNEIQLTNFFFQRLCFFCFI